MPAEHAVTPPTLSILCAAHDTEPYLAEAIDSVVAQTVGDWELIVVDNGMSDEVVRIVGQYADDQRIRLLRQEFRSLAGGIDAAAGDARGSYYAVLPSDGRIEPTFCERVAEVLAEHPGIDVLCIDALPFVGSEDRPPTFRQRCGVTDEPGVGHSFELVEIIREGALYHPAAIRASAWDAAGGYVGDTPQVDDLSMCIRLAAAGRDLRVLPEPLGRYRLRSDADRTRAQADEYDASVERAFLRAATLTDDPAVRAEVRTVVRNHRYARALRLAREAMRTGDPATARQQAWLAFRQRPGLRPAALWAVLRLAPGGVDQVKAAKRWITGLVRPGTRHP
ncbi:glycosyltransferase family A protein [Pseudonocardia sp. DLS-67]